MVGGVEIEIKYCPTVNCVIKLSYEVFQRGILYEEPHHLSPKYPPKPRETDNRILPIFSHHTIQLH